MREIVDPHGPDAHPGNPSVAQLFGPVSVRLLHSLDARLMGVLATFWNPSTGQDEEVTVLGTLRGNPHRPLFMAVLLGSESARVQGSLLCESRDGVPVPRFRFERVAMHNSGSGRAIVFDEDGARYTVETRYREGDPYVHVEPLPEGLIIGHWLQPAEARVESVPEPAPFTAFQKRVCERPALESLIFSFSCAIDPGRSKKVRRLGGKELEKNLAAYDPGHVARFREIVLNGELAATASTRDAPMLEHGAALLAEVVAKWGHRPREAVPV